jgi:ferrous iron transport protein A
MSPIRICGTTMNTQSTSSSFSTAPASLSLTQLGDGKTARVVSIECEEGQVPGDMVRRLAELGFLPGELVRVIARGLTSRSAIAVRVGTGTFALRTFEAACIRVAEIAAEGLAPAPLCRLAA